MKLPFDLKIPKGAEHRLKALESANEVVLKQTKNWIDIIAVTPYNRVYVGTIISPPSSD